MNRCEDRRVFIYRIDAQDTIIFVNESWLAFAAENDAPNISLNSVLNKPLWNFITDIDTEYLYKLMVDKVRTDQISMTVLFRCDSPSCRRLMELEIHPLSDNGVEFTSTFKEVEWHKEIKLLDVYTARSDEVIRICSWCKKVCLQNGWVDIEDVVEPLSLFTTAQFPKTSHSICPSCKENVLQLLE